MEVWHFVGDRERFMQAFGATPEQALELMRRAFDWNGEEIGSRFDAWIDSIGRQVRGG